MKIMWNEMNDYISLKITLGYRFRVIISFDLTNFTFFGYFQNFDPEISYHDLTQKFNQKKMNW